MNWQPIVSFGVLAFIGLAIWAKVSGQTIIELIKSIVDYIKEK